MANSWKNRVKFIVRYMYDYDGNGVLDKNDFECLAVRNTIMEGKGTWIQDKYAKNKEVMTNLWNQISDIADFDKNGEVDTEEEWEAWKLPARGKNMPTFQRRSSSSLRLSSGPLTSMEMVQSAWRNSGTTVSAEWPIQEWRNWMRLSARLPRRKN